MIPIAIYCSAVFFAFAYAIERRRHLETLRGKALMQKYIDENLNITTLENLSKNRRIK